MGKKSDLSPECQKFVKKLFAFFNKEKAMKKPIVSFDRVYQRTSKALGVSYTSITMLVRVYCGTSLHWYELTSCGTSLQWYELTIKCFKADLTVYVINHLLLSFRYIILIIGL